MISYCPHIFLPIESTKRELDYKINLARRFAAEGLSVIIGNPPFIRDELKYKNYRGAFLEKGVNPDPDYYKALKQKNIILFDLSDEGAAFPPYAIQYPAAEAALMCMRNIFLWGETQRKSLCKLSPQEELISKYIISGYPGLDLSQKIYKPYHSSLAPIALPPSYILINTNFGCINSYSVEEQLAACPSISPQSREGIIQGFQKEEKSFPHFCEWTQKILSSFPNETFLIRPHPVEQQHFYDQYFSKFSNVVISKEGTANQVISRAKLVIHSDCTTALQSYLIEVPVISLANPYLAYISSPWSLAFSMLPQTADDAVKQINYILQHKKWSEADQSRIDEQAQTEISKTFAHIGSSTSIVVDTIMNAVHKKWPTDEPYTIKDSRTWLAKLKHQVRKHLPLHYKIDLATRETLLPFSKSDIEKRLKLFEQVDPLGCRLSIKKLFPNAYKIRRI